MGIANYEDVKGVVSDFLDRDDLAGQVGHFVEFAEARIAREVLVREMLQRGQAVTTGRYLCLPTRFIKMKTFRLLSNPVTVLTEVNLHEMNRLRSEATGRPTFYTIHEEIEFDTTPDDTYSAEMIYYAKFVQMTENEDSTPLLLRAPDLYIYGSLVAAAPFLVHDERVPMWEQLYGAARDGVLITDRQGRVGTPLASRVAGAMP